MRAQRRRQRGFNFLALLFFVAITSAALAALGQSWRQAAQRERERELDFRGGEIARAIAAYVAATPAGQAPQYPGGFDELLIDRRGARIRHHLRRLYADPFTRQADWVLLPAPTGLPGFQGVHSRAEVPLLKSGEADGRKRQRASERRFTATALLPEGSAPPPADSTANLGD